MDEKSSYTKDKIRDKLNHTNRNKLLIIFLIACSLRLAFSVFYWVDKPITHDAQEYLLLAERLVDEGKYGYDLKPGDATERHERAPLYPLFLATIFILFGKKLIAVKIIQSIIVAFLPLIIFGITRRLFSRRAAFISAIITIVYPPLIWGAAELLSETLFTVVAILGFYFLVLYTDNNKHFFILLSAITFSLAAHIKPVILMAFPLLIFWLWFREKKSRKYHFKDAVIFSVVLLALLVPWMLRNYLVSGRVIIIASEGGITFWTGNHPLAVGDGDMAANPQIKNANKELRKKYNYPPPAELEKIYMKETIEFIKNEPLKFSILLAKKAFYFWFPIGRSMSLFSWKHQLVSHLSYFPVLIIFLAGTINLIKRKKLPILPYLSILSAFIACVLFFPQERYRIPLTDPFMISIAAYYIDYRTTNSLIKIGIRRTLPFFQGFFKKK